MIEKIVPVLSQRQAKENITVDVEQWKNFAQRITKNPFVKSFLLKRDGNRCGWCKGQFLKQPVIHHINYDHHCSYNVLIQIPAPTLNNPFKTRFVPDCKNCKIGNNDRFMTCMNKLVLVHNFCNKRISDEADKKQCNHLLI